MQFANAPESDVYSADADEPCGPNSQSCLSTLCVPCVSPEGRIVAVLQLTNKVLQTKDGEGIDSDLDSGA